MGRFIRWMICLSLVVGCAYGAGRAYFALTGGFTEGNITADVPYDPRWESKPASSLELEMVKNSLSQPYYWLGKGCQSYVFASADGKYVIKFIKYQRFRTAAWLNALSFIPSVNTYLAQKAVQKEEKLAAVFRSWKLAYEELPQESGIVYLHLNKVQENLPQLLIYDKLGFAHEINLNDTEFLLQKRADMLCPTLEKWIAEGQLDKARALLDRLFAMIVSEYHRGYADNDHALMQNTGVSEEFPVHIDVGQFIKNSKMKDPNVYNQELYNKMYKFNSWLRERSPELSEYVDWHLRQEIGEAYPNMQPYFHVGNVAKIPNEE